MTTVHTVATATHTAYMDPMTGSGMLVCPEPAKDLCAPPAYGPIVNGVQTIARASVHGSDWDAMLSRLAELGWTLLDNPETGELLRDGETRDGRMVIALYGDDPIITEPSIAQLAEASTELRRVVSIRYPPLDVSRTDFERSPISHLRYC